MRFLLSTLFFIIFSGCAVTNISGIKNTDYKGNAKSRIVVYCLSKDLNERINNELVFCNELNLNEIQAYPLHKIIHPKEKLELKDIYDILNKKNIEALLIVRYDKLQKVETRNLSMGAGLSYKPKDKISIELIESETGKLIWNSISYLKENISNVADETANDLLSNNIILPSKMNYYDLDFKDSGHFNKLTR